MISYLFILNIQHFLCYAQQPEASAASHVFGGMTSSSASSGTITPAMAANLAHIAEYRANIFSSDPAAQLKATQQFRRLLSIGWYFATFMTKLIVFVFFKLPLCCF